jgi:hypothetical protein
MKIPKQLSRETVRLVKLRQQSKKLLEKEGNRKEYAVVDIETHVQGGGNWGILGGHGGLVIVDSDSEEVEAAVSLELPATFTVKTPKKWRHRYYLCEELGDIPKFPLKIGNRHVGDVILMGGYAVGPGSIHPDTGTRYEIEDDSEIVRITKEQLFSALTPFMKVQFPYASEAKAPLDLEIEEVLQEYAINLKQSGSILSGAHPIHGSSNGGNFSVNSKINAWHCFRCDSGGGPIQLVAMMEGYLDCADSKKGSLKGEKFVQVARIVEEKFRINVLEHAQRQMEDKILSGSELCAMTNRVQAINAHIPRAELPAALERILETLASIDEIQAMAILDSDIQGHFGLKHKELEPYRRRIKEMRKRLKAIAQLEVPMSAEQALRQLHTVVDEKEVHPAIDYLNGSMCFGVKMRGQLFLVTSDRRLLGTEGGRVTGLPLVLKHKTIDYAGFSLLGVDRFIKGEVLDPVEIFFAIRSYIDRYVYFANADHLDLLTVWIIGTYLFPVFRHYPYLWINADKGSGKTTLLDVIQPLAFNAQLLVAPTPAVLFREVAANRPTLLIDEFESMTKHNKDVAASMFDILNAGYNCNGQVKRTEPGQNGEFVVRTFSAYGPKVLCGISRIDSVLQDRTIQVRMLRKGATVRRERYKCTPDVEMVQRDLRDQCYGLALAIASQVAHTYHSGKIEHDYLAHLSNRELDLWEPLASILHVIDGDGFWSLLRPLLSLSVESLEDKATDNPVDPETSQILYGLKALLESDVECKNGEKQGERLYKAAHVLSFLTQNAELGLFELEQKELTRRLRKFHINAKQRRDGKERSVTYAISTGHVESLIESFGLSV